ncbi:hypothetical protein [Ruegeria sp. HKCCD6119]|uniref:hypothetical protein n=1 Tax=Ruegeria sp. HKCCD6119 TaxID=2683003 RepID=UPI001491A9AF|nr:hypothetical protein [Ruegeria sp. HKCCD6119]NOD83211.1 hypothetical protein [Ruegeria sp. HKCCD6119]
MIRGPGRGPDPFLSEWSRPDSKTLKRTKALHGQVSSRFGALEKSPCDCVEFADWLWQISTHSHPMTAIKPVDSYRLAGMFRRFDSLLRTEN